MESAFCCEPAKFIGGSLTALSTMVNLELPHINVLTKCDLMKGGEEEQEHIERYIEGDTSAVIDDLKATMHPKYRRLNEAMGQLLDEYSLVSFVTLNKEDEDSVELCLAHVNNCIQYGEDLEPQGKFDNMEEDDGID